MNLIQKAFITFRDNPKEGLRKTARRLLPYQWLENEQTSYLEHHRQYASASPMEWQRERFKTYGEEDLFNAPPNRIRDLMAQYPEVRDTAVDIGSGAGWASAELSKSFSQVIGIEPSDAAIGIARQLFPTSSHPNIDWRIGFSQDVIPTLSITAPALWVTMVVLSHLPDNVVSQTCQAVNRIAKPGSLLSFSECWGPEFHDLMWHVRTPEWWRNQLPGWELDFHGPSVNNVAERRKGIHGRKVR
jgi:hypothetical protein